jgi:hypothetical protein
MEISKDQIAVIKSCLGTTVILVERLIGGLECKTRLEDWQKKTLLQHRELLSKCNKSNWVLDCLHPVQVIPLEDEAIELLPPSSNSSVAPPNLNNPVQCRCCKDNFFKLMGTSDDLCLDCYEVKEQQQDAADELFLAEQKKQRIAKEQEEIREQRKILIERSKAIQKEKDKRNTAISQMRKEERKGLKEQITLLETIGYDNLEREEKRSLTVYKARLAKMESDCSSVD